MHEKKYITAGKSLEEANKVLVMLHGRGGSAADILQIGRNLDLPDFAFLAPQAYNNSWYPLSFMAPEKQNEPWLTSALDVLKNIEEELNTKGFSSDDIYFFGFSQGACLTLEYMTRNAKRYGGGVAIIGGLIGENINTGKYITDFEKTPIFIGTSDPDSHVPLQRVEQTAEILEYKNANVLLEIYRNVGHTILQEELELAESHVFKS